MCVGGSGWTQVRPRWPAGCPLRWAVWRWEGGQLGLCIRKASLANRDEKWYTEARLGDAGNRLDLNPPQWTGRCLGVGLLGSPLQRLKSWAGAVFLNLPAPLSDGGKPGLAQGPLTVRVLFAVQAALQPAEGAQETRHREQGLTLTGAPCGTPAPPARVARLEWSRARAELAAPCTCFQSAARALEPTRLARTGGGAGGGPPGRPSGRPPCQRAPGLTAASVGEGRPTPPERPPTAWPSAVSSMRGFQVTVLIFSPSP